MPYGLGDFGLTKWAKSWQDIDYTNFRADGEGYGNRVPLANVATQSTSGDPIVRAAENSQPPVHVAATPVDAPFLGPIVPIEQPVSRLPIDRRAPEITASNPTPPQNPMQGRAVPLLDNGVPMPSLSGHDLSDAVQSEAGANRGEASAAVATIGSGQISAMVPILLIAGTAAVLILVK